MVRLARRLAPFEGLPEGTAPRRRRGGMELVTTRASAQAPLTAPLQRVAIVRAKRAIAAVLTVLAAVPGGWAALAPQSFYDSFPAAGHHWVSMLGPYDEHLVRDVGVLQLALMVTSAWVAIRPRVETCALVGLGWITFATPHLVFHLNHLSGMSLTDQIANVVNLAGTVILALALAIPFTTDRSASAHRGSLTPR